MILSDKWIRENSLKAEKPLITPFIDKSVKEIRGFNVPSYGLSSFGYDIRLGNKFKVMMTAKEYKDKYTGAVPAIDPGNFPEYLWKDVEVKDGFGFYLPPRGFALGVTQEHFNIPRDVMGVCMQKSTNARSGFEVVVTPLEAEWSGFLTLEIFNKTDFPVLLLPGIGIAQMLFLQGNEQPEVSYKDRDGKYNNQPAEPIAPR